MNLFTKKHIAELLVSFFLGLNGCSGPSYSGKTMFSHNYSSVWLSETSNNVIMGLYNLLTIALSKTH